MPKKSTTRKARADARRGKKPSTQAGRFVKEEIDDIRRGKHGAANAKQAIAIGLSKARKAGVKVGKNPNRKKKTTTKPRKPSRESSARRARASSRALKKKPRRAASHRALSRHTRQVNRRKK